MRIAQAPWPFDVPLPPGSRVLRLAVSDAGDRSPYDLANWVAAGFLCFSCSFQVSASE